MTQPTKAARIFDAQTVNVETRYNSRHDRLPCINVKVHHGFEVITPEQWAELRNVASEDATIPADSLAGLTAEWCSDRVDDVGKHGYEWWNGACQDQFMQAEEEAKALFGKHIECFQDGRSGGWLVVKGLQDVEEWHSLKPGDNCWHCDVVLPLEHIEGDSCVECGAGTSPDLPSLKGSNVEGARFKDGTTLSDSANILERWAFFVEVCAGLVRDVPYTCAWQLAANAFAREEGTRDVEFLRAWINSERQPFPEKQWDTDTLQVPRKVKGHDALVTWYADNRTVSMFTYVGVFNDPKAD